MCKIGLAADNSGIFCNISHNSHQLSYSNVLNAWHFPPQTCVNEFRLHNKISGWYNMINSEYIKQQIRDNILKHFFNDIIKKTVLLRDTVHQISRGELAAAGLTTGQPCGQPQPLTPWRRSGGTYYVITQFYFNVIKNTKFNPTQDFRNV